MVGVGTVTVNGIVVGAAGNVVGLGVIVMTLLKA